MTYQYRCRVCGVVEAVQRITSRPLRRCPVCRGKVKRVVSGGAGFRLKGEGWTSPGRA